MWRTHRYFVDFEISTSNRCHNFHVDSPFKIDVISTNFPREISTSNRWRIDKDASIGQLLCRVYVDTKVCFKFVQCVAYNMLFIVYLYYVFQVVLDINNCVCCGCYSVVQFQSVSSFPGMCEYCYCQCYHSHKKHIVWKHGPSKQKSLCHVEIYRAAQYTGNDFKKNIAFLEGNKQILC